MEDDKPKFGKNVMGSPTNPNEALGTVMDKVGSFYLEIKLLFSQLSLLAPLLPNPVSGMTNALTSFHLYFPIRLHFSK